MKGLIISGNIMKNNSRSVLVLKRNIYYIVSLFLLLLVPILWNISPQGKFIGLILIIIFGGVLLFSSREISISLFPKPILLLLIFFVYQSIFLIITPLPQYSIELVATNFAFLIFFVLVLVSQKFGWKTMIWENALISVAFLYSLWSISRIFTFYMQWINGSGDLSLPPISLRVSGPLVGSPNHFAGFLNLIIPIVLVRLIQKKTYRKIFLWGGIIFLFLVMEFYTSSRGGWISLIFGVSTTLFLVFIPRIKDFIERRLLGLNFRFRLSIRQWMIGIIALALFIIVAVLLFRQIQMTPHGGRYGGRFAVWVGAWRIFSTSPFIGRGTGSYPFLYSSINQSPGGDPLYHAHNLWLQIGVETGIVGILLVIWATLLIIHTFISAWKNASSDVRERYTLASYAGVGVALLVHNLVDFLFRSPIYYLSVILILALLISRTTTNTVTNYTRKRDFIVLGGVVVISILGSIYSLNGVSLYSKGLDAARDGDWSTVREEICKSAEDNMSFTLYDFQCSLASAIVSFKSGDKQILNSAIEFQIEGLEKDPFWFVHWGNLASYEWEQGNRTEALLHMRQAVSTIPTDSLLQLNLGWMEEELNHQEQAIDAYRSAIILNPWLRESIFFTKTEIRREVLETSTISTDDMTSDIRAYWEGRQAYLAGDLGAAEEKYRLAIRSNPLFGDAYAELGLLQQQTGKPLDAWKNIQIALFINGSSFRTLYLTYKVAQSQGKYTIAMEYLIQAYRVLQNINSSYKYYDAAYHMDFLPTDKSPYLLRWGLSAQMKEDFQDLALYFQQHGDIDNYQQLMSMIENESSR